MGGGGVSVSVYQLLFDFGNTRGAAPLLSSPAAFLPLLFFWLRENEENSFPRGLGYSVSGPHTYRWEAIFPPPSVGES